MKLSEFDFDLPDNLIAQHPPEVRGASRLLVCPAQGDLQDQAFADIRQWIRPNDLLVLNNTKVLKARLFGEKASGGKIEVMLERILDDRRFTAMIRASKAPKPGGEIVLAGVATATVLGKHDMMYEVQLAEGSPSIDHILDAHGTLPLPPYITHDADQTDEDRYQTVFAKEPGAVAAPTAGLHFTDALLDDLKAHGTRVMDLTLHVGAGTFLPVKTDNVDEHVMHRERYSLSAALIAELVRTKQAGGRVVAVGTTSLRALEAWGTETACNLSTVDGLRKAMPYAETGHAGDTDIFIKPGYTFHVVDCLITNFHLPKSTLLMLVSAFAGKDRIFAAYAHAVAQQYRFFSYGDAMWLERAAG
ncbi:tRNA preQ1(34) S-adenosylmethionine ribosyltransferase-isomerase QueA [Limnobacter humi]|uniref:S-adenosylmethionine:tRNA ribosyltransferase-isomerase n=1 Tax=Limnobacter humi TaxID=1778671 RepID=A0ABT1WCA9_9BURK|nr:tRNA preQ1(34) S-adenosylmethionine ribosyltransferase-isomerase QueA [Limnobacter humi]MCQ8895159.1 tRNA preQ1(34) S-adenosylmethionine ribosyltransferase-isomerase QueA [Limnobacter humi]